MLNHKKLFAAFLLAPLFAACVVNGDDDDDGAGTETDATSVTDATMTTTMTSSMRLKALRRFLWAVIIRVSPACASPGATVPPQGCYRQTRRASLG